MLDNTKIEDTSYYIDWLEKSISEERINYYHYEDFKDIKLIGSGSFGSVVRATWKNTDKFFALKSFLDPYKTTLKEIINEV